MRIILFFLFTLMLPVHATAMIMPAIKVICIPEVNYFKVETFDLDYIDFKEDEELITKALWDKYGLALDTNKKILEKTCSVGMNFKVNVEIHYKPDSPCQGTAIGNVDIWADDMHLFSGPVFESCYKEGLIDKIEFLNGRVEFHEAGGFCTETENYYPYRTIIWWNDLKNYNDELPITDNYAIEKCKAFKAEKLKNCEEDSILCKTTKY